jgi:hypothetical protein
VVGPSHCWSSALFRRYGDIGFDAVNEDAIIQFRASLVEGVDTVSEPLVKYRVHAANVSNLSYGIADVVDRERQITHISYDRFLKCLQNYQRDLAAERSFGCDSARLVRLERLVATRIRLWELRLRYLEGNYTERIRIIVESAKLGLDGLPETVRMLFQLLFPRVYRFIRRRVVLLSAWQWLNFRQRL